MTTPLRSMASAVVPRFGPCRAPAGRFALNGGPLVWPQSLSTGSGEGRTAPHLNARPATQPAYVQQQLGQRLHQADGGHLHAYKATCCILRGFPPAVQSSLWTGSTAFADRRAAPVVLPATRILGRG